MTDYTVLVSDLGRWEPATTCRTRAEADREAFVIAHVHSHGAVRTRVVRGGPAKARETADSWNAWASAHRGTPEHAEYLRVNRELRE